MNKDEILEASRKENKSKDLAELEVSYRAGNIAGRIGATVCCLISVIFVWITDSMLYSPWIIYFSILGTNSLVKYLKIKRKSDLVLTALFFSMCILGLVFFILRLTGKSA